MIAARGAHLGDAAAVAAGVEGRAGEAAEHRVLDGERAVAGDVVAAGVVHRVVLRRQRHAVLDGERDVGGRDHEILDGVAAGAATAGAAISAAATATSGAATAEEEEDREARRG